MSERTSKEKGGDCERERIRNEDRVIDVDQKGEERKRKERA